MKKIILTLIIIFVAGINTSRAQWTEFNTYFPHSLFSVDFTNDHTGYAVGQQGTVLKTTDGAIVWEMSLEVPGVWFNSVYAYNSDIVIAVGSFGAIYYTTDGGNMWMNRSILFAPSGYHNHFRDVTYNSAIDKYVVVGYDGAYFEVVAIHPNSYTRFSHIPWTMHSIVFDASGKGIIAATDGRIYRTGNNGATWNFVDIQSMLGVYDYLNSVVMMGPNKAVIVGNNGRILRSTNAGVSWTIITHNITWEHLRDVDAVWDGHDWILIAVGDNATIIKSGNGGSNWFAQTASPFTWRHLYGVSLPSINKGYIVGEVGTYAEAASYMNDNLNVSVTPIGSIIPNEYSLKQNYPNPFNPATKITFSVPEASIIRLKVFDIAGRTVAELVNQKLDPGIYEYEFNATDLNSGTYFYRLESNNFVETKKMILIK